MTDLITKLTKRLNENLIYAREQLAKFAEQLSSDPVYAFTWADKHFRYAAHVKVCSDLLENIEAGSTLDQITTFLGREVLRRAKNPARSTSVSSNMMETELMHVYAEILEYIDERS